MAKNKKKVKPVQLGKPAKPARQAKKGQWDREGK